jgi:hypothetical protein
MEGCAVNVKNSLLVGLIFLLSNSAEFAVGQTQPTVPSRAERVARARWEPSRRMVMEEAAPEGMPESRLQAPMPGQPLEEPIYEEGTEVFGHPPGDPMPMHGGCNCESCGGGQGHCDSGHCGLGCDSSPCDAMGYCGDGCGDSCGYLPRLALYVPIPTDGWFQADALLWWLRPMQSPALVTTSPANTSQTAAGVLGRAGTTTLVGGQLLDQMYSGSRFRVGFWTDRCRGRAVQAEFFGIGEETEQYSFTGNGSPILARPFFNGLTNAEDSELVSFPGNISGTVGVDVRSKMGGIGIHWMQTHCCSCGSGRSLLDCCCRETRSRISSLVGYRWMSLREDLTITEDLTSLRTVDPGSFDINDNFRTKNRFNGLDVGVTYNRIRGRWSIDMLMKLGIGTTNQQVDIAGSTVITGAGSSNGTYQGGLLAQRTNIGSYSRNRFSVLPELGVDLGYQLNPFWRARVGYTFLYWTSVVRPGDQIDREVNPNLLPVEAVPFTGPLSPEFKFVESNLWVNGLNLGLEFNW